MAKSVLVSSVVAAIIFLPAGVDSANSQVCDAKKYKKENPSNWYMLNIGNTSHAENMFSCSYLCTQKFIDCQRKGVYGNCNRCHSFMYEKNTKQCTLGSWISNDPKYKKNIPGALYISDNAFCDKNKGLRLLFQRGDPVKVPVGCWDEHHGGKKYQDAVNICKGAGLTLLTAKTQKKYMAILSNDVLSLKQVWIGIDDIRTEGQYRWVDDGSLLTQDQKKYLFGNHRPDDAGGKEDCIHFHRDKFHDDVSDGKCSNGLQFFCEHLPSP